MIPYSTKLNKLHSYDSAASRTAADLQIYHWCKILDLSSLSHTGNSNSSLGMELPELPPINLKPITISYYYSDFLKFCGIVPATSPYQKLTQNPSGSTLLIR